MNFSNATGKKRSISLSSVSHEINPQIILPTTVTIFISTLLLGIISNSIVLIMPLLVGALVDYQGFTAQQAGMIVAADIAGTLIGSLLAASVFSNQHWRKMALISLIVLCGGNLLTLTTNNYQALMTIRMITGVFAGFGIVITFRVISIMQHPTRIFALLTLGWYLFSLVAFAGLPMLLSKCGPPGAFGLLSGLSLLSIPLIHCLPNGTSGRRESSDLNKLLRSKAVITSLLATLIYFISQGAAWAFLDRVGSSVGLSAVAIGEGLFISVFGGVVGASMSAWISGRYGYILPLSFSIICSIYSLYLLGGIKNSLEFTIAVSLLQFSWSAAIPYYLGLLSIIDNSGNTAAFGPPSQIGGYAIGPAIAALTIQNEAYNALLWLSAALCLMSLLMLFTVIGKGRDAG